MTTVDTPTPAAVIAEQSVLAVLLNRPSTLPAARQLLTVADFWQPSHATVFGAILDLADQGTTPDAVAVVTHLGNTGQLARVGTAAYIHTLYDMPATAGNLSYYAEQIRTAGRRRRLAALGTRIEQIATDITDDDALIDQAAREAIALDLLIDERTSGAAVEGLWTWDEFLAQPDRADDWVVPGLVERQDVVMILAGEGSGKSWLSRQLCQAIAAGVHPFQPAVRIPPQRTLLIDLENPVSMTRRQSRPLHSQVARLGDWTRGNAYVWMRPEGLNLREHADAHLFERVVAETRPAFVAFGSLYKAFHTGRDSWETAADEVRAVFDRVRARHRIALWLEHHMPKGDGSSRPQLPFGSSVWQRWAGYGRVINRRGDNVYELTPSFRGDRDQREFPAGLYRGGELPWSPIWEQSEVDLLADASK
jgi:hypothetical protein